MEEPLYHVALITVSDYGMLEVGNN